MTEYANAWLEKSRRLIIKHDILVALLCAVALITIGLVLGSQNNKVIPFNPHVHYRSLSPPMFLSNWDGNYYIAIARHGYTTLLSTSFYPLYPLMVRVFYYVFRSYLVSALFVSWVSLVAAIYFYIKVIRELDLLDKDSIGVLPVLPFILFPTAVFLIATYPEALFAALALSSIYFSLRRRYICVGVLLSLAAMTHITGIFLIVVDALILREQKVPVRKIAVVVGLGICAAGAFTTYLYVRFHNALAFFESQTEVHGWLDASYRHLILSTSFFNLLFSALLIASAVFYWRKRKSFAVYSLLFLLIPIVGRQWGGFDRYVLVAFPIPFMIQQLFRSRRQTYLIIMVFSAMLWTYTLLQYTAGYIGS